MVWRATTRGSAKPEDRVESALPVAVVRVTRENLAREITVEAEFHPYQEVDLHAKVAGFLQSIAVDIGDRVAAGQEIASLEIPELQDDLRRSRAAQERASEEVTRATAAFEEARTTLDRLEAVGKSRPGLIAEQDLDTARSRERQAASVLAAARHSVAISAAETAKFETMARYARITAPFPGVITRRYADRGALIQAGVSSSTQAMPLVRVSELDRLRLVFPVSMSYVSLVSTGSPVQVRVQHRSQPIPGVVARFTHRIEAATRTMEVEVDVDNPDLWLIPGMYATVTLGLEHHDGVLTLPVQAVARGRTSTAYLVNSRHELEERPLTLGLETPTRLEILSGVGEGDMAFIGNRSMVKPGDRVEPRLVGAEKE
jgi:RND family efflux transporter MFP subunit